MDYKPCRRSVLLKRLSSMNNVYLIRGQQLSKIRKKSPSKIRKIQSCTIFFRKHCPIQGNQVSNRTHSADITIVHVLISPELLYPFCIVLPVAYQKVTFCFKRIPLLTILSTGCFLTSCMWLMF